MTFLLPDPETVPITDMLIKETAKEQYERKIIEFREQIEDYQYTVEGLQKKNLKLEKELEELPKLRDKVGQLRHSRVIFKGQIKEFQKKLQKAKKKAELNEKRFKGSLLEQKSAERKVGPRPRVHNRKPSVTMP